MNAKKNTSKTKTNFKNASFKVFAQMKHKASTHALKPINKTHNYA
jgi:hypothetical protein